MISQPENLSSPGGTGLAEIRDDVVLEGSVVRRRTWNPVGSRTVLLIHGAAAHSGWWDLVAPSLATRYRVVAVDLPGFGESSHPGTYSHAAWVAHIMALVRLERAQGRPTVLVGHSLGGILCLRAALAHGTELAGLIVIESAVREYSAGEMTSYLRRADRGNRVYGSLAAAVARFRPLPDGERIPAEIHDRLARMSVRQVDGGWTWKFDHRALFGEFLTPDELRPLECPVMLIRGEAGTMTHDISSAVARRLECPEPARVITGAGHHVMLEQPHALLAALRPVLARWLYAGPPPPNP
jgi:pimeloyl-ACP methyl ester carboxylesterase